MTIALYLVKIYLNKTNSMTLFFFCDCENTFLAKGTDPMFLRYIFAYCLLI